jgi:ribonuclease HI
MKLIIHTDGGINSDKSMCTAAFVAYQEDGTYVGSMSMTLKGTTNQAEYCGIGLAATHLPSLLARYPVDEVEFRGDSELMINQLRGRYRCKDMDLRRYRDRCLQILETHNIHYSFEWVPREKNKDADYLCNLTKEHPPKTDIWAPIPIEDGVPSLGQLFREGRLNRPRSMRVDADGFGLCDRCRGRLAICACPPLYSIPKETELAGKAQETASV